MGNARHKIYCGTLITSLLPIDHLGGKESQPKSQYLPVGWAFAFWVVLVLFGEEDLRMLCGRGSTQIVAEYISFPLGLPPGQKSKLLCSCAFKNNVKSS